MAGYNKRKFIESATKTVNKRWRGLVGAVGAVGTGIAAADRLASSIERANKVAQKVRRVVGQSAAKRSKTGRYRRRDKKVLESIQHNDMSKGYVVLSGGKSKKNVKAKIFNTIKVMGGVRANGALSGIQGVFQIYPMAFKDQLVSNQQHSTGSFSNDQTILQWPLGLFGSNVQYDKGAPFIQDASTIGGTGVRTNYTQMKAHLLSIIGEWTMQSATAYPQEVHIYFLKCKKDTNNDPIAQWNLCRQHTTGSSGWGLLPQEPSTTAVDGKSGAPLDIYQYGEMFTQYKEFGKYWEIDKKETFILQGGASKRLRISYPVNKTFTYDIVQQYPTTFMKGVTVFPLVIVKPGLVFNVEPNVKEDVYPGQVDIMNFWSGKVHIKYSDANSTSYLQYNGPGIQIGLDQEPNERIIDVTDKIAIPNEF